MSDLKPEQPEPQEASDIIAIPDEHSAAEGFVDRFIGKSASDVEKDTKKPRFDDRSTAQKLRARDAAIKQSGALDPPVRRDKMTIGEDLAPAHFEKGLFFKHDPSRDKNWNLGGWKGDRAPESSGPLIKNPPVDAIPILIGGDSVTSANSGNTDKINAGVTSRDANQEPKNPNNFFQESIARLRALLEKDSKDKRQVTEAGQDSLPTTIDEFRTAREKRESAS